MTKIERALASAAAAIGIVVGGIAIGRAIWPPDVEVQQRHGEIVFEFGLTSCEQDARFLAVELFHYLLQRMHENIPIQKDAVASVIDYLCEDDVGLTDDGRELIGPIALLALGLENLSASDLLELQRQAEEDLAARQLNGNNFGDIADNVTNSIGDLPGMLTGGSYQIGILLGVLDVLEVRDHVENPAQNSLDHGAIRLTPGRGLFSVPVVYDAMTQTVGADGRNATGAQLNAVEFNVE